MTVAFERNGGDHPIRRALYHRLGINRHTAEIAAEKVQIVAGKQDRFPRLHLEILAICNPHAHAAFEHEVIGDDLRSTTHNGPTPVEFLLQAIAVCLTAGIGNIASARGVELTSVEAFVEGDIDLLGILGISDQFRNGYNAIRVNFAIEGNAPKEKLRQIVEQSAARSAVFDVLTNGTAVTVTVNGN